MIKIIETAARVTAAGNMPKMIDEFFGRVNSGDTGISIARMKSPEGWIEPGQQPEFDEYTIVLSGRLVIQTKDKEHIIEAGQAVKTPKGEWVKYSSPFPGGAEYIAVCLPAFSPDTVHRDME